MLHVVLPANKPSYPFDYGNLHTEICRKIHFKFRISFVEFLPTFSIISITPLLRKIANFHTKICKDYKLHNFQLLPKFSPNLLSNFYCSIVTETEIELT